MTDKELSFLPFHAINQFMLDDFRQEVLQLVMTHQSRLPQSDQGRMRSFVNRYVQIPGFRKSDLAPVTLKIKGLQDVFEKLPALVALVLKDWVELKQELRQPVYDFLAAREWKLLPVDFDRSALPGFLYTWPKGQDFEVLTAEFRAAHPECAFTDNDIALMMVWVAMRLPYEFVDAVPDELSLENIQQYL